jgi:propionyl-CoA carboxylase alpha chain
MPMTTTPDASTPGRLPRRLLIANRGEIAVRIARTARAMGITPIGVASDADADSLHARSCTEVVRLPGNTPADTYLRVDLLLEAAERTGADAVHPGFGFLAEDAGFARATVDAGLTWVGPRPETIAAMGDKLAAKRTMAAAGVPVLPGVELTTEHTDAEVHAAGAEVGFPLLVKATGGGGGKGMRTVQDASTLLDAVAAARREAAGAFSDDRVFLERLVARPRHLEVQILGDTHGQVLHLFERECSIQRRHQKVIEETPAPGVTPAVRDALTAAAVDAARTLGYVNAGTVEFVGDESLLSRLRAGDERVDPREAFAFLEVNTRLQVEHPVTEAVVRIRDEVAGAPRDLDLVRLQLLIAAGAPLLFDQDDVLRDGHAIEARLYAEDPAAEYLPSTGTLHVFAPAPGSGIRWDSGVVAGDEVSPFYDPMLAKVIAHAPPPPPPPPPPPSAPPPPPPPRPWTRRRCWVSPPTATCWCPSSGTTGSWRVTRPRRSSVSASPTAHPSTISPRMPRSTSQRRSLPCTPWRSRAQAEAPSEACREASARTGRSRLSSPTTWCATGPRLSPVGTWTAGPCRCLIARCACGDSATGASTSRSARASPPATSVRRVW